MINSPDDVPLLIRREIEARVLAPFVDALTQRFGREPVIEILKTTIEHIARDQADPLVIILRRSLPVSAGLDEAVLSALLSRRTCATRQFSLSASQQRRFDHSLEVFLGNVHGLIPFESRSRPL